MLKLRTHEQIKYTLFEQVLDAYEVNLSGFAQINNTLFAHVYKALAGKRWLPFFRGLFSNLCV